MPQVTTNNRRMTNVKLANGEYIQGIRRNNNDNNNNRGEHDLQGGLNMKPLRYTPGLVCDAHLESLRPERDSKHSAFSGPETHQWRKKLIDAPKTFEGSFVDADMQQFRPEPAPVASGNEPWFTSRVPDGQTFPGNERLLGANSYDPYGGQVYPQDELSQIKMRNRRFQSACGGQPQQQQPQAVFPPPHPQMYYGYPPPQPQMMYPPPPPFMPPQMMMMQQQQQQQQLPPQMTPLDDLKILDQELNMTRQVTRPFVPVDNTPEFSHLQRQREIMEEPALPEPRLKHVSATEMCPLSIDDLPAPKKPPPNAAAAVQRQPEPTPKPKQDPVRIADQIAIRSIVLGHNLPKIGKGEQHRPAGSNAGSGCRSPAAGTGNGSIGSPRSSNRSREQSV